MIRDLLKKKNETTAAMSAAVSDSRSGVNCSRTRVRRCRRQLFTLSGGTAAVVRNNYRGA